MYVRIWGFYFGNLSEDDLRFGERYVNVIKRMWRYSQLSNKGPKIRGLEDHLINQMEVHNSIDNFIEDFVK